MGDGVFDSHCHLTAEPFSTDLDLVLQRARAAGVHGITTISSTASDSDAAWDLAGAHEDIWCTAGIHPHEATTAVRDFGRIREAAGRARVVAIGETGLDYHYEHSPRETQRRAFDLHVSLAAETGLPLVVHSREAEQDTIAALVAAGSVRGVLHCFTGGEALLDTAIDAGWYVSFGGMVTFRKWTGHDLLRRVPAGRLLLETDGPYLAPVPHRGHRNEPAFLAFTCEAAARIRAEPPARLAAVTEANARAFYGIA